MDGTYASDEVADYRSKVLHYPKIADLAERHLKMYPDCACKLFLPSGGGYWGDGQNTCLNCKAYFKNQSLVFDSVIASNVFIHEFILSLLNLYGDSEITLCVCCMEEFRVLFNS